MFGVALTEPNGTTALLGISNGYLEVSLNQSSHSFGEDRKKSEENEIIGAHLCNQEDRSNFYDDSDHISNFF